MNLGIPEDGLWAYHWYKGTHASTGFVSDIEKINAPDDERILDGLPIEVKAEAYKVLPRWQELHSKCLTLLDVNHD